MQATEMQLEQPYVEYRDGVYRVADTRVSLDSIVYAWRRKQSPESIQHSFPVLKLSQVLGALAYYLDHQEQVDEYLLQMQAQEREFAKKARELYPDIHQKMDTLIQALRRPLDDEDQISGRQ
ncbi:MAG TPA: DUF433 domain-containing protein [Blastocatellia bacterium]|nr:DUF433 domain-containing protein [Blastocatellia bacterium]HMX29461.1 DUF433 domain-containing protein [Blastocatellia bacterium]HMY76489.1 DUF433 domain-containing protein [Blastocatellia bacterium]HMZ19810.1 DUF433 domain-containing protein [Blastocatellia bacterium]HNG28356.1 DUF433 domain-containing protein [Blastocatellia bacterium]